MIHPMYYISANPPNAFQYRCFWLAERQRACTESKSKGIKIYWFVENATVADVVETADDAYVQKSGNQHKRHPQRLRRRSGLPHACHSFHHPLNTAMLTISQNLHAKKTLFCNTWLS